MFTVCLFGRRQQINIASAVRKEERVAPVEVNGTVAVRYATLAVRGSEARDIYRWHLCGAVS